MEQFKAGLENHWYMDTVANVAAAVISTEVLIPRTT
jgi:hypothetical protein